MAWTERQQALLDAMGLRVWSPPIGAGEEGAADGGPVPLAPAASVAVAAPTGAALADAVHPVDAPDRADAPGDSPEADGHDFGLSAPPARPPTLPRPVVARGNIASLDWSGLRASVAACTACGLCASRRQTVFGTGHQQADWMVVGEAPGEQEDEQGEPFVGASGQLLDRMLAALKLTRSSGGDAPPSQRVYIANTLKCRPPRNRNPTAEELAQCEPFLVRQIELLKPRIILAMGRFAVQTLLRSDEPLGKLRGRVHRYQGVPLVVTYHPAYLLRSLQEKAKAWEDLCLAADTAAVADRAP